MSVSETIATTNVKRFKSFRRSHNELNSNIAINTFDGDVYKGLDAESLDQNGLAFAQEHVRILSGLYGLLKPLDLMQEYRLEMGTRLPTERGANLYQFWGDKITKLVNKDLKESGANQIINLASNEYFKAIDRKKIKGDILTINFKEYKDDQLKFISFNAKKARGLMTRYIVDHRLEDKQGIKGFNTDGYYYSEENSTDTEWLFVR